MYDTVGTPLQAPTTAPVTFAVFARSPLNPLFLCLLLISFFIPASLPIHLHSLLFLTIVILLLLSFFCLPCPVFALSYVLLPSISPNPSSLLIPHPLPPVLHSSSYSSSEYSLCLYTISQDFSFSLTAYYTYFPSPPSPFSSFFSSWLYPIFLFSFFLFLLCSFCFLHFSYSPFLPHSLTISH